MVNAINSLDLAPLITPFCNDKIVKVLPFQIEMAVDPCFSMRWSLYADELTIFTSLYVYEL